MRSALRIVASRWAITKVVRPFITSSRASCSFFSVAASRALVASSRIENRRVLQERPRDGKPLPFAARQRTPAFADDRGEAVGLAGNEFDRLRALQRFDHLGIGRFRPPDLKVLADRAREQHRLLEHDADIAPQGRQGQIANVVVVDADRAGLRIERAVKKTQRGGFSRTRRAHERHVLARQHRERHVLDGRALSVIGETDILERHLAGEALHVLRIAVGRERPARCREFRRIRASSAPA